MNVDDIEGSRPKQKIELKQRDNISTNDIEGSKPKQKLQRTVYHD
jgi:hypothetical protein